jgi:tetratricopeptide (TPR) repeat protein
MPLQRRAQAEAGCRWLRFMLCAMALGACQPLPDADPILVLLPLASEQARPEAEQRGMLDLIAIRLRAVRGLSLRIDSAGCASAPASHALRVVRRATASSDVTAIELLDCATGHARQETFVQRLDTRRDWSHAVAWWVAGELHRQAPTPRTGAATTAPTMAAYFAAIGHLQQRTADSIRRARELLRGVVADDPDFADAHAELAIAELLASEYGLQSLAEASSRAERAVEAALALDTTLGLAHAARGLAAMMEARYQQAIPLLLQAHRLEPGHDAIQLWLGNALLYGGQPLEALPWLQSAAEINPGLLAARISIGEAFCYAGQETACRDFLASASSSPMLAYVVALLRAHRGEHAQVHALLSDQPPAVDPQWVADLMRSSCVAANLPNCPVARSANDDGRALEADLWALDLGLGAAARAARAGDTAQADALRAELSRLRSGEVRLPVIDALERCLEPTAGAGNAALARLLGCWD